MIRDPSDGTVREKPETVKPVSKEEPSVLSSPEIIAALMAGKVKPERLSEEWVFQRGWNEGIEFALRQIKIISQKGK